KHSRVNCLEMAEMSGLEHVEMMRGARIAVENCMGLREKETLLIVTDTTRIAIANALAAIGYATGADVTVAIYTPRQMHGEEPPNPVAEAMKAADVVLAPTKYSITHTKARKQATDAGARIATMPMITEEMLTTGAMTANYVEVKALSEKLTRLITEAKTIRVTSPAGTDVAMKLGRKALADTGIFHTPGSFGNLPAGEAYTAPLEGTAEGVMVVDGSIAGVGILTQPVTCTIRRGRIEEIAGGVEATTFREILAKTDANAWSVAEVGLGANAAARLTGNALEDEKVLGTVHIAVGNNLYMGGNQESKVHLDAILQKPTVTLDELIALERGELRIE
ncbi:MAG: aminopeptidase, partial [Candidatus Bathyarchaeia archaeon]